MKILLNNKKIQKQKDVIINKFQKSVNKIITINNIKKVLIKRLNKIKKNKPENVNMTTSKKIIKFSDNLLKCSLFSTIKNNNKNMIDTFSTYYDEFIINKKDENIKIIKKMYDKNHSRFLRLIELSYLIKKDDELYNSNLIFNYHTLGKLHKKDDNFNVFLNLLREEYKKRK